VHILAFELFGPLKVWSGDPAQFSYRVDENKKRTFHSDDWRDLVRQAPQAWAGQRCRSPAPPRLNAATEWGDQSPR